MNALQVIKFQQLIEKILRERNLDLCSKEINLREDGLEKDILELLHEYLKRDSDIVGIYFRLKDIIFGKEFYKFRVAVGLKKTAGLMTIYLVAEKLVKECEQIGVSVLNK